MALHFGNGPEGTVTEVDREPSFERPFRRQFQIYFEVNSREPEGRRSSTIDPILPDAESCNQIDDLVRHPARSTAHTLLR